MPSIAGREYGFCKGSIMTPLAPLPAPMPLKRPALVWGDDEVIGGDDIDSDDESMAGEMLSDGDGDGLAGAPG